MAGAWINSIALFAFLSVAVGQAPSTFFVFSHDARYVQIALEDARMVDVGNLWYMDVHEVNGIVRPTHPDAILLMVKNWRLLGIENPTREEFERRGIAKLSLANKRGLLFKGLLPAPEGTAHALGGRRFPTSEPSTYITWQSKRQAGDEPPGTRVVIYDDNGMIKETIEGFRVWERSCFDEASQTVHTPRFGHPREIVSLDLKGMSLSRSSYEHVGRAEAFSRFAAAACPLSCKLLAGVRQSRGKPGGFYHVYDYVKEEVLASFPLTRDGEHAFLPGREAILLDEKRYIPLDETSARVKKLGRLHIVEYSGRVLHTFDLPKDGRLALVSSGGALGLYISPGMLTVLDFEDLEIESQVEIPFQDGHVALIEES